MDDFSLVNNDDMNIVSKHIGKEAYNLGRALGLEEGVLDGLFLDHDKYGNREVIFKMLIKWKNKLGDNARCELLVEKLDSIEREDIATKVMDSHFPGRGLTSARAMAIGNNPTKLVDRNLLTTATPVSGEGLKAPPSLSSYAVSATCQLSIATWEDDDIKDEDDSDNCWLCSIGGYYRIQLSRLQHQTTVEGPATLRKIVKFYEENGACVNPKHFLDWKFVIDYLRQRLVRGAKLKVVLGFDLNRDVIRPGKSSGHVVVLKALRTKDDQILYRVIDFSRATNDPLRKTDNELPDYATNPYWVIETDHDVYESPPIKTSIPSI